MTEQTVTYSYTIEDGVVCIVDRDEGGMSVTNGIEHVLNELRARDIDLSLPIIYRDTMGVWDEIIVKDETFVDFQSIGVRDKEKAKEKVRARHP